MPENPLEGKVALVTGAAHGVGKGISMCLARAGANVAVADIEVAPGQLVAEQIRTQARDALFIDVDLRSEAAIKMMVDRCVGHFGRLDILVNNAKPRLNALPFEQSLEEWDLAMDVLLKAPALAAGYACQHLGEHGGGSIVNIASTNARYVSHQPVGYHVAKAGLLHLTRYLAREFGPQGIRANTISPGLVDIHDDGQPLTSRHPNKIIAELSVPLQRAGEVEEIGDLVVYLCSEGASYITGQNVTIDGGITVNDHFHVARTSYGHEYVKE